MSALTWVGLGLLGGVGAILRFALDGAVSRRLTSDFPSGTLAVNLLGSLALGVLVGVTSDAQALRLIGAGLLGSFTTFSTWMLETDRLAEDGEPGLAWANLLVSLVAGLVVAWLGMKCGAAL